jgi:hypothetical protein
MVARTAYAQLDHSRLALALTVMAMAIVYLVPPMLAFEDNAAGWVARFAWGAMVLAYVPMLRFYRVSALWAPLLPSVAAVYLWATLESAWRHYRGEGGQWKGRVAWQSRR